MNYFEPRFFRDKAKGQDIFQQKLVRFGSANKDKIIYYIKDNDQNVDNLGFFAMYRRWLEYLYFADICGYVPVICTDSQFAYKEREAVHGTTNPFEYYFEQPAAISVKDAKRSNKVVLSDYRHREMVELVLTGKTGSYKYTNRYLYLLAQVAGKYIKPNQYMQSYMENGWKQMNFNREKMLGVHMRGTDYRAMYNAHPIYVTNEECYAEIDKLMERNLYSRIFLATDDKRILEEFIHRYGDKICFYRDVERGGENKSIAFHDSLREKNKYLLGLEVIRDMYTLSMCAGLIAGVSQVAVCAQIHKLSTKQRYEDRIILDKGLYKNHNYFVAQAWQ